MWRLFDEYTFAHDLMPDLGCRLDAMVEELGRAAARVRLLPRQAMEGGLHGKVDVVLRAVAHARRGDGQNLAMHCDVFPELRSCMQPGGLDRQAAVALHRRLVEEAMAAELAELERSKVPELQKTAKRAKVRRSMPSFRLQRRRVETTGL